MLTDCLVKIYKIMVELFAWVLLFGFGIAGYFIGNSLFNDNIYSVIGIILGLITGFIIESIILPPCIILYKIHSELNSHNQEEKDVKKDKENKASNMNSKVISEIFLAITTCALYFILSKSALGALFILSLMVLIRINKLDIIKSCLLASVLSCITLIPILISGVNFMDILSIVITNLISMIIVATIVSIIVNKYDKNAQRNAI